MNPPYGVLNNSSLIIDTDKLRENVRTTAVLRIFIRYSLNFFVFYLFSF